MNKENNKEIEIDLMELFRSAWNHAPAILITGIICALALFMFAQFLVTPKYEASTLFYLNSDAGDNTPSVSAEVLNAAAQAIVESRSNLEQILSETGAPYTYEEFSEMIDAQAVSSTTLFRVTVRGESPEEARMLASAIADFLPEKMTDTVRNSSAEIIEYPVTPKTRVSPNYFKYTAAGLLAGMLLSGALFIIRDMKDDIIRGGDCLLQAYAEVPVIGVIPDTNAKTIKGCGCFGKGGR